MGKMNKKDVPEFKMLNLRFKILILVILYIIFITFSNSDIELVDTSDLFGETEPVVIPEGTAIMTFFDVGQGDSSLIQFENYDILIDAGESQYGDDVVDKLNELGVDDIEFLVATHPHSDHIGGISEVLENFSVENFVMPKVVHTTKTYETMIDLVDEKNINVIIPTQGQKLIELDGILLQVISPVVTEDDNLNNYSICLKFDYGNTRSIYTGDAETKIENMILESGIGIDCDIFQVGHHGSVTSNSESFLNMLTPQIAIISCGKNNDYGHPHKEVVDRFEVLGTKIYRTDMLSDIRITTNGNSIEIK